MFKDTIKTKLVSFFSLWMKEEDAIAAVESALVFPILLTLLLGTFDMGNGILSNQKTIRASQVVADLITRERTVDINELNEAIEAGTLALQPYPTANFGIDVVSIRFDDDANPEIVWRETRNMSPMANVLQDVESLAEANGGVVVVGVEYLFEPIFAGFIVNDIAMQEVAFARGRKSAVVNFQ